MNYFLTMLVKHMNHFKRRAREKYQPLFNYTSEKIWTTFGYVREKYEQNSKGIFYEKMHFNVSNAEVVGELEFISKVF